MYRERDAKKIQFVGSLALGLGVSMLILTLLAGLFLLFAGWSSSSAAFVRGLLAVGLALVMSVAMAGCGGEMQRTRMHSEDGHFNLRMVWTALVLVMFLCGLAALWVAPPLFLLAGFMLLALVTIRGSIQRLTSY